MLVAALALSTNIAVAGKSKLGRIITPCCNIMAQTSVHGSPLRNVLDDAGTVQMVAWPRLAAAYEQTQIQAISWMAYITSV